MNQITEVTSGGHQYPIIDQFQVLVDGWQTPRQILICNNPSGSGILFEIAEADGCSTCQQRIREAEWVLDRNGYRDFCEWVTAPSAYRDECLYLHMAPDPTWLSPVNRKVAMKWVMELLEIRVSPLI